MPRREYRLTVRCTEPGCRESAFFIYDRKADYSDGYKRHYGKWKCVRHDGHSEVLAPGNETATGVLIASRVPSKVMDRTTYQMVDGWLDGLFWLKEGTERGGSGFVHGPGFRAFASDWPAGTRLVVTARILPPGESTDRELTGEGEAGG